MFLQRLTIVKDNMFSEVDDQHSYQGGRIFMSPIFFIYLI
uniref:Uncharacterized protein n=1 Tax=Arundo donax TaxID=35708 RepID=A0A0A8ZDZ5_ARUDO